MACFESALKVRTYECDLYGHVNNATFLNYLEFARVEFLEAMGYTLKGLLEKGFVLPIVKIEIEYRNPAFPNDDLLITIDWIEKGKTSAVFEQNIYKNDGNTLVVRALVKWVVTDLSGKPITIPDELIQSYQKFTGHLPPEKVKS